MFGSALRAALCALMIGTTVHQDPDPRQLPGGAAPGDLPGAGLTASDPLAELLAAGGHDRTAVRRVHRVTAYCDRGLTAAGVPSGVGQCAAPADVPFGSIVYLPDLDRAFIVTDRTAQRFRHNTVDIFIPDRDDCLEFGLNYFDVEIYPPLNPPSYGSPRIARLIARVD